MIRWLFILVIFLNVGPLVLADDSIPDQVQCFRGLASLQQRPRNLLGDGSIILPYQKQNQHGVLWYFEDRISFCPVAKDPSSGAPAMNYFAMQLQTSSGEWESFVYQQNKNVPENSSLLHHVTGIPKSYSSSVTRYSRTSAPENGERCSELLDEVEAKYLTTQLSALITKSKAIYDERLRVRSTGVRGISSETHPFEQALLTCKTNLTGTWIRNLLEEELLKFPQRQPGSAAFTTGG